MRFTTYFAANLEEAMRIGEVSCWTSDQEAYGVYAKAVDRSGGVLALMKWSLICPLLERARTPGCEFVVSVTTVIPKGEMAAQLRAEASR